jgi:hypothetical protein
MPVNDELIQDAVRSLYNQVSAYMDRVESIAWVLTAPDKRHLLRWVHSFPGPKERGLEVSPEENRVILSAPIPVLVCVLERRPDEQ